MAGPDDVPGPRGRPTAIMHGAIVQKALVRVPTARCLLMSFASVASIMGVTIVPGCMPRFARKAGRQAVAASRVGGLGAVKHREFAMATGEMSGPEFSAFLSDELRLTSEHCEPGAVIMAFMDWRSIDKLICAGKANGLALINLCVWNKTNASMGSLYRSKHELIGVFKKPGARHRNNVQLGSHGRYRTNVWDAPGCNSFGRNRMEELGSHPTVKPVRLVADAIRDVSNRGEIVLDSFVGSGTTLIAAERTDRIAYGIELDPLYVDTAIRRWEQFTGREAVLESTGQSFADTAAARASGCQAAPYVGEPSS